MVETHRSGFVAIVGRPNVGKSTLLNALVGEKIAITTPKPQTTRDRIRGIASFPEWQVVFVDTPGIHDARNKLNRYMVDAAIGTFKDVDLVYFLVDAEKMLSDAEKIRRVNAPIFETLEKAGTPAILVLNKVDMVSDKGKLLPMIEELSTAMNFNAIVPLSALKKDGIDQLLELTRPYLPEGPALFPGDEITDRTMRFMAREIVREHLFMALDKELPYQIAVSVLEWKEQSDGVTLIHITIHVSRASHKGIVIGKGGARLKRIGQRSRRDLESFLSTKVFLDLHVRVEEGWTDRERSLRKLGYNEL
jgi:GTP-binding protein Era